MGRGAHDDMRVRRGLAWKSHAVPHPRGGGHCRLGSTSTEQAVDPHCQGQGRKEGRGRGGEPPHRGLPEPAVPTLDAGDERASNEGPVARRLPDQRAVPCGSQMRREWREGGGACGVCGVRNWGKDLHRLVPEHSIGGSLFRPRLRVPCLGHLPPPCEPPVVSTPHEERELSVGWSMR